MTEAQMAEAAPKAVSCSREQEEDDEEDEAGPGWELCSSAKAAGSSDEEARMASAAAPSATAEPDTLLWRVAFTAKRLASSAPRRAGGGRAGRPAPS
jgi:hypothetical protein